MDRKQALAAPSNAGPSSAEESRDQGLPPPAYSTSHISLPTESATQFTIIPLPSLDYASYRPPFSIVSSDQTTVTTSHRPLAKEPQALADFIRHQASLPPRPVIRLRGTYNAGLSIEFEIKINLLPYLYRTEDSWNYLSIQSSSADESEVGSSRRPFARRSAGGNRSLEHWCHDFIKETSSIKTFTLTRSMVNFDLPTLSGLIRNTFADLKYRGQLEISLETTFNKITVDNQPTKGASAFFRPLVSAFVASKDYHVVTAVWPWARTAPDTPGEGREFANISEKAWWGEWKNAVIKAAMERRVGWVTSDDRVEAVMTGWARDVQVRPWGSAGLT